MAEVGRYSSSGLLGHGLPGARSRSAGENAGRRCESEREVCLHCAECPA